ncbi:MAG TPA: AraC family transcriptional regulator [Acetobacteraceae bacterium]|nr:AraC family transcriptional regulator [Acetobacteraceae bacterium]
MRDHASGVEAIRARFAGHAYDMHRHDDWLVGVTDHGIQDFFCRGVRRRSTPGRVILIEPEEAHDGEAGADNGFAYRMLYLPRTWLRGGLERTWDDDIGFRTTLTDDVRLAAAIRAAWMALSYAVPQLTRDAVLDAVIGALRPHLGRPTRRLPASHDPPVARRARETLHAAPEANIGLSELARSAGATDRFQLARAFRASYGTTPHAYLVQLRLVRAREHLARGMPPADVAAACGFADQSHLGRWFRRAYGLTPAAYRACCTNVRDTSAAFT